LKIIKYSYFTFSVSQTLKLSTSVEWEKYSKSGKKPIDILSKPSSIYKGKGWKNWPQFLGRV